MIEELRQMGNEALTAWTERGVEKSIVVTQTEPEWRPGGGEKTLLVPHLWFDHGDRTALAERYGHRAAVQRGRRGEWPVPFAAITTGDDGVGGGSCVWAGAGQVAGALWNYDAGEHDSTDDRTACCMLPGSPPKRSRG